MSMRRLYEYAKFLRTLAKVNGRLLWGMWKLTKLPQPAITVFGGSRIPHDSIHAKMATNLTKMLAGDGFSIITGGGPGIMSAANQGAIEFLKECNLVGNCRSQVISAGIGLLRLNVEESNPYVQENIQMTHFFSRKWLLVRYSVGFAVFPGGFGTLDELFEIVTLVQCNRMTKVPIVMIDKGYWQPIIEWIDHRATAYGLVTEEDKKILTIVDTVEEAFKIISEQCKGCEKSVLYNGNNNNGR
ncbi:MAG: TIGR00730 family Rossman fold protein [Candidatus Babeliales bacterium]